jgi:hypothetical protein
LYHHLAGGFIPSPRANFARVVINGESWGVYLNVQHVNTDFTRDWFRVMKGARWKADGSKGRAGLHYLGEDVMEYRRRYDMKSKDSPKAWADLIHLCRVLNETPAEKLEAALAPVLDLDGALKFLALENALINNDGFWNHSGDYDIFEDERGVFHLIPRDVNNSFGAAEGKKWLKTGIELDPLAGADDPKRPLPHKLLAVPALRLRYLEHLRAVATDGLDPKRLGPFLAQCQSLLAGELKNDTRLLHSPEAFTRALATGPVEGVSESDSWKVGLNQFATRRREFLLNHPEIKKLSGHTDNPPASNN